VALFRHAVVLAPALLLWWSPLATAGDPPPSPAVAFLQRSLSLDDGDAARLARGEMVAHMVEPPGFREIGVVAVAPLPPTRLDWGSGYALVERLRRCNPDLLAMGPMDRTPRAGDLSGVEVDERILIGLQKCQVERCVMNGSRDEVVRYARDVEWRGADPRGSASAVFRQVLRDRMTAYLRDGDSALPVLANRSWPLTTADAPALLLDRRSSLAPLAPRLDQRFRAWAHAAQDPGDDVFYWCRERMWRREVVGLFHAAFDDERTETLHKRVVAEKLVYSNHYLLGALTVTGVVEDASGAYLFFLNRSETDNRGAFNFLERALAGRLIKRRLVRQVEAIRDGLGASGVTTSARVGAGAP
jgi:hypothetical protein